MLLSIVVPVLNEENHILDLLNSLSNIKVNEKEIFLVDGGSNDNTIKIISDYIVSNKIKIRILNNPDKHVSNAFNLAYSISKGKYIALIGAHAIYSTNYFKKSIEILESNSCDVVGGILIQKGRTKKGKIIAKCMSSRFGVGNTSVRTTKKKMFVDSVAFAVYRRKIFDKTGLFDTQLIRNQDDEFHYRLNQYGFKILLLPSIYSIYYVRDNFKKLFIQYFYYGFYKPLVFIKVPSGVRIRHLVPLFFVIYLISIPFSIYNIFLLIPLGIYIIISFIVSVNLFKNIRDIIISMTSFFILHFSYGFGNILGMINFYLLRFEKKN